MKIQEMYIEVNIHYVIIKIHLSDFFRTSHSYEKN